MTCQHPEAYDTHASIHLRCECCKHNNAATFDRSGRTMCRACGDWTPVIREHVSFKSSVVPATTSGVCMFCGGTATFVFNTGEHICERCIR